MPSLGGPTGIVTLPTAGIAPVNQWQTAVTLRTFDTVGMYDGGSGDATIWSVNILKGVAADAELWAAYSRATDGNDGEVIQVGGKYQLAPNVFGRSGVLAYTQVAVGGSIGRWSDSFVRVAGSLGMYGEPSDLVDIGDVDVARAYLVATKQIYPYGEASDLQWGTPTGARAVASAGLLYQWADVESGGDRSDITPFAGLEVMWGDTLEMSVEYRKGDDVLGPDSDDLFSASLRHSFGKTTHVEIGVTNASAMGVVLPDSFDPGGDQEFFVRLGYDAEVGTDIF
jgi:hypothetical protein